MEIQNIRDVFWDYIYEQAQKDHNVVIVSADLGAKSLDAFRDNLPTQFISAGIAEQAAIEIAAGLALAGKKVYVYACEPFIFMRCYEQIKLCVADTNLPITIVGQGMGVCYSESGATHHSLEDVGAIRMLPNITMYTPSDECAARKIAEYTYMSQKPTYVRLDRPMQKKIYGSFNVMEGFGYLTKGDKKVIISSGHMLHYIMKNIESDSEINVGLVDLYSSDPNEESLMECLKIYEEIFVVEEHCIIGGIGSYMLELSNRYDLNKKVHIYGMDSSNGYKHQYGTREELWKLYGINISQIKEDLKK